MKKATSILSKERRPKEMDKEQLELLDIEGFEGLYYCDRYGNIYSNKTKLKYVLTGKGYGTVCLYKNTVCHRVLVHRIIAKHFIDNPLNKETVNHINGIKTDNRVENLEWSTYSENIKHAYKLGLNKLSQPDRIGKYMKGRIGKSHPRSNPVLQISLTGKVVKEWSSIKEAADYFGINSNRISRACILKTPVVCDFNWSYKK